MPANVPIPSYIDLLGDPFERGARGPDMWDCYGLVREMYHRSGVEIPDFRSPGTLEEIAQIISDECRAWRRVEIGTLGALHTFRVDGIGAHVAFGIGRDRFLHAIEGPGVTTDRYSNPLFHPLAAYDYV